MPISRRDVIAGTAAAGVGTLLPGEGLASVEERPPALRTAAEVETYRLMGEIVKYANEMKSALVAANTDDPQARWREWMRASRAHDHLKVAADVAFARYRPEMFQAYLEKQRR
jgi:hypothetical protein